MVFRFIWQLKRTGDLLLQLNYRKQKIIHNYKPHIKLEKKNWTTERNLQGNLSSRGSILRSESWVVIFLFKKFFYRKKLIYLLRKSIGINGAKIPSKRKDDKPFPSFCINQNSGKAAVIRTILKAEGKVDGWFCDLCSNNFFLLKIINGKFEDILKIKAIYINNDAD